MGTGCCRQRLLSSAPLGLGKGGTRPRLRAAAPAASGSERQACSTRETQGVASATPSLFNSKQAAVPATFKGWQKDSTSQGRPTSASARPTATDRPRQSPRGLATSPAQGPKAQGRHG